MTATRPRQRPSVRAGRPTSAPSVRVSVDDLIKGKVSMLGDAMLPAGYGKVEGVNDVLEIITKEEDQRVVRLHIVWDNPIHNLDLESVLEQMRGTGAAMVVKVEEVKS
jgi:hypothetical protein